MILYLESSAVLPGWLGESAGPEAAKLISKADKRITSELTCIECERTLLRAAALGAVETVAAERLQVQARELWANSDILSFDAEVVARARQAFPCEPIRTLDALHLAFFESARRALGELVLLSLDRRIRAAAEALGWAVLPG